MNTNIIITAPAKDTRAKAREFLAGKWKTACFAMLIFYFILEIPVIVYENIVVGSSPQITHEVIDIADLGYEIENISFVSSLYTFLITAVFILGLAQLFLSIVRGINVEAVDVFNGFEYFLKAVGLFFMMMLFIFLWGLLLIVPGIIAALRYSQAFFILADNPDMSIMACIEESKRMMNGNKWKLFCLELSFIGWDILASLPLGISESLSEQFNWGSGIEMDLLMFVLSLIIIVVIAYMETASAVFYEAMKGKPIYNTVYTESEYTY